jgi:steroid delta-isomerase-like uncharacterized protein
VSEENKALARRFLEAQAKGDMETLDELMAPNFVDRSLLPGQKPGREDYKQSLADMLAVFENTSFNIEAQIAEGDQVVSRYRGTSVHRGRFLGVDPTGQETSYSGITIHRIADGKIVEEWGESDNLEVVQPALEQEMRRRERIEQEKMAALGKLSAGLALEYAGDLSPEGREVLLSILREATANDNVVLDPLSQSDREEEIATWLVERGFGDAWDLAPVLGAAGLNTGRLEQLAAEMSDGEPLAGVLRWLGATLESTSLAEVVGRSAGRISDLVGAMKEYTHMDRATYAGTDVREGLENVLTILGHKLKGVAVVREYAEDLPRIWANAGELNQVWSNLLDNAADAVAGRGRIWIKAYRDGDALVVQVVDDGPGMPVEIHNSLRDR